MKVVRYSPWQAMDEFHSDLNHLLRNVVSRAGGDRKEASADPWHPTVDIKEEAERFVLYADIPGVSPQDVEVTMEKGILTVKGERRAEKKEEGERYALLERSQGTFQRRFTLPESADADSIEAHVEKGVLRVIVPKQPERKPRRIPVAA